MENDKHPVDDLKNDEITEKREKFEMLTVGPGICEITENVENEKHTLQDVKYGEEN